MTDSKTELSQKELRSFGLVFAGGITLIFGAFFPWLLNHSSPMWPWVVAGIVLLPALLMPILLSPIYKIWMKIGHVLGWINTRIILGIIFFMVFTPVALVLLLLKKDPLKRTLNPNINSYRIDSIKAARNRMENPF